MNIVTLKSISSYYNDTTDGNVVAFADNIE